MVNHLNTQLAYLESKSDRAAYNTVAAILEDEKNHRDIGSEQGSANNIWYAPLRFAISLFTESVIRFGMR